MLTAFPGTYERLLGSGEGSAAVVDETCVLMCKRPEWPFNDANFLNGMESSRLALGFLCNDGLLGERVRGELSKLLEKSSVILIAFIRLSSSIGKDFWGCHVGCKG